MSSIKVKFDNISYSGYGVGVADSGETVYAWNAFPGETAEVSLFSKKQPPFKGTAIKILEPSPYRIEPEEKHFLVSAPWQAIDYEYEVELKQKMFTKIWQEQAGLIPKFSFVKQLASRSPYLAGRQVDEGWWYYRNSLEFNVVDLGRELSLALMSRGRKKLVPIIESKLVYPVINKAAKEVLASLNTRGIKAGQIKQLIVKANRQGQVIVGVYGCTNELIYRQRPEYLEERVNGFKFRFGLSDFWQPNIAVFEQALAEIKRHIQNEPVVDMYAGVGVIGLSLAGQASQVWLVEKSPVATKRAQENIKLNNITNTQAISLPAEQALEYITSEKIIFFDPPRSGLDNKIIKRILASRPSKIIYLSCKPYTQCLDIKQLLSEYKIVHTSLYNFFPRTPHFESLVVLQGR